MVISPDERARLAELRDTVPFGASVPVEDLHFVLDLLARETASDEYPAPPPALRPAMADLSDFTIRLWSGALMDDIARPTSPLILSTPECHDHDPPKEAN